MDRAQIYTDNAGKSRWRIVAPNHKLIDASSESFEDDDSARRNLIRAGHGALIGEESSDDSSEA